MDLSEGSVPFDEDVSYDGEIKRYIPNTIESLIERTLFDTICGFSSGVRQGNIPRPGEGGAISTSNRTSIQ